LLKSPLVRDPVVERAFRPPRGRRPEEMLERVGDVLLRRRLAHDQRGDRKPQEETANHFSTW
jgi:hypothetical protein